MLGEPGPEVEPLLVVSPHFDDGVLSLGAFLSAHPGSTVVTVTGGAPPGHDWSQLGDWDALAGFTAGEDVVAARRAEDAAALAELSAAPVWLEFPDEPYRRGPLVVDDVAGQLVEAVRSAAAAAVAVPMGLGHADHVLTHEAGLRARHSLGDRVAWFLYADGGYQHLPGLLASRLGQLSGAGVAPTPVPVQVVAEHQQRKRAALLRYPSQLRALAAVWGADPLRLAGVAESLWRLPSGAGGFA